MLCTRGQSIGRAVVVSDGRRCVRRLLLANFCLVVASWTTFESQILWLFGRRTSAFGLSGLLCPASPVCSAPESAQSTAAPIAPSLPPEFECGEYKLTGAELVGIGTQAAVFGAQLANFGDAKRTTSSVAVKVDLRGVEDSKAADVFSRECAILQTLEAAEVLGVEQCLAACFIADDHGKRPALVLSPLLPRSRKVGSWSRLAKADAERNRIGTLMRTAVRILEAGIAGVDVQVLQQEDTGQLLWIDFSEAVVLPFSEAGTRNELVVLHPMFTRYFTSTMEAAVGFVGEVFSLVPPDSLQFACEALVQELRSLVRSRAIRGPGARFAQAWAKLPWCGFDMAVESELRTAALAASA